MIHEILRGLIEQRASGNFCSAGNLYQPAIQKRLEDAIHGDTADRLDVSACDRLSVSDDRESLQRALGTLEPAWSALDADLRSGRPADAAAWRTRSLTVVARLIARAALRREESRGGHYRRDFPERDDLHWKLHIAEIRET